MGSVFLMNIIFYYSYSQNDGDKYKMLIGILHFFLNRSINIIMEPNNRSLTVTWVSWGNNITANLASKQIS